MLRVMLVDDEPLALEGLSLLIDWKKEGFEVCASCNSAKEALEVIASARPHLIVTDIQMQDMNGLDLMSAARKMGYGGVFVVVSGYGNFEYAKKAMSVGVSGYLLKPVDAREASEVLEHVRKELVDKELRHKLPLADYQQNITALLMGQQARHHALPAGAWLLYTWGMALPYDQLTAIVDGFADTGIRATTHVVDGREWLVLSCREGIKKAPIQALEHTLSEIGRSFLCSQETQTAEQMLAQYRMLCAMLNDCGEDLLAQTQALANAVSLLQYDEFVRLAKEFQLFCQLRGSSIKAQAIELFSGLCVQQLAKSPDKLAQWMKEPAGDVLALGIAAMRLLAPTPHRISDQVKEYMQAHFTGRLTLEGVAAALGYNATYLGRIFREETGTGFRSYLNDLRVQKAAGMMHSSNLPVHKIADAVGYNQYKLFLAHFKRLYGKTPGEYRQGSISP